VFLSMVVRKETEMHDLVIRGAHVVDGTGAVGVTADVAVDGIHIVDVGRDVGPTRRVFDADGLVLTPGFVDIHTHFDGQASWDPHLTPSCWNGVTTAVMGNCGVGFAPVRSTEHQSLIEIMEGVEDIPGSALSEGIRWDWETLPEYFDALSRSTHSMDLAAHVPHAAVRAYVMGDRALEDATAEDLRSMAAIVRGAVEAGAVGFATGRTAGHRDSRGKPVPGTFAPERELVVMMDALVAGGGGVFQLTPAGVGGEMAGDRRGAMESEIEWIARLGIGSGQPVTFLVMEQGGDEPEDWHPWFDAVGQANRAGARIHPQIGSRCFGVLMGHQSRLNPFRYRPSYAAIANLPLERRIAELRRPEVKARILEEHADRSGPFALDRFGRAGFENLFPLGPSLDYEPAPEASVAAIARREGRDPWEVAYDTLLQFGGREFLLLPLLNYGGGSYDGLYEMMLDPFSVQGLGDAGAHVGLVCDASMTTYLLTHWARDRTRGPRLTLETAVRRLTSDPATLYGFTDRGVIAPGMKADFNLLDFQTLRMLHPEQICDLPGGAGRLVQRAEGFRATFVSGVQVLSDDEVTGELPGAFVRRLTA
jgi:N-acyl-D-amino-acid deacylase